MNDADKPNSDSHSRPVMTPGPMRIDAGETSRGRGSLPEPDFLVDMLLEPVAYDEPEWLELRVSMSSHAYRRFAKRADWLGVNPSKLMDDLVASSITLGPGFYTGVELDFSGEPHRDKADIELLPE